MAGTGTSHDDKEKLDVILQEFNDKWFKGWDTTPEEQKVKLTAIVNAVKQDNDYIPLIVGNPDKQAARDMIACYLRPIERINTSSTSYGLKHLIERALHIDTQGEINYVSNGTLILAMYDAGFRIKRLKDGSQNCYFNVSKKSINNLNKYVNR